ncbi:leucine-rich repeat-containing protein 15-like [Eriocheir sinensis]|uniref:leucine-rich repeat-containing protein 15-like n=1 Tax=Eriocheir sinensis TaxID=95602 RepID=UPI0021C6E003|nr:leucine-rich repeat-containing protein 15-like [Eriocheir sinensis]
MFVTLLLAVVLDVTQKVRAVAECPCIHREADPLFPGAGGYRWDCEYVSHGLTEVPTACWAEDSNVTQVFLDYNEIETVPSDSFVSLTNVRTLSLRHNEIGIVEEGALSGLSSLEFLDLASNRLGFLPSEVWNLRELSQLYLGDNNFYVASTFNIKNLVNLQVLDLHLNHLSDMPLNSLEPLTKLRKLHLYWNMFVSLPVMTENHLLEEVLVNGNALLDFPKYMFGNLTSPLTYHFVDNPAYDVWATMLLPLPDKSHIVMGSDVTVWAEDEQQAEEVLLKDWLVQDGLSNTIDLSNLLMICGDKRKQPSPRQPLC